MTRLACTEVPNFWLERGDGGWRVEDISAAMEGGRQVVSEELHICSMWEDTKKTYAQGIVKKKGTGTPEKGQSISWFTLGA